MAKVASKKQLRMFHAILNKPKGGRTARGDFGPPASIAQKYINDSKAMSKETKSSLPESKGQEMHGGKWEEGSSTHKKAKRQEELRGAHKAKKYAAHSKKAQQKAERAKKIAKKKYGSHLKKAMTELLAFDQQYMGRGVGVIIFNDEGKMLLGKDSTTGKWGFIGGHVDENETYADAVFREAKEETGISITNLELLGQTISEGNITNVYTARAPKGSKPKGEDKEISIFKWMTREDIATHKLIVFFVFIIKYLIDKRIIF